MKKPVLKFCSHDVNQALVDRLHAHPYWQMEYITGKSSIRLCDRNGECGEVPPGVFVLIPPLTPHRFLRSGNGTESYSLKFIWEAEAPGQEIQRYSVSQVFFAWSAENLIRIFSGSFPVRQRNLFLEYLLLNFLL